MPEHIRWSETQFVVVPRVACPNCDGDYITVRSQGDQGDGSRLRRCVCKQCATPFQVIQVSAKEWQDE